MYTKLLCRYILSRKQNLLKFNAFDTKIKERQFKLKNIEKINSTKSKNHVPNNFYMYGDISRATVKLLFSTKRGYASGFEYSDFKKVRIDFSSKTN